MSTHLKARLGDSIERVLRADGLVSSGENTYQHNDRHDAERFQKKDKVEGKHEHTHINTKKENQADLSK